MNHQKNMVGVHRRQGEMCPVLCYKERRMRKDTWKCAVISCATTKKYSVQEKAGWRLKQEDSSEKHVS